jgi:uncharacterized protein (DUF1800 family)
VASGAVVLCACAPQTQLRTEPSVRASGPIAAPVAAVTHADVLWLGRVTFGVTDEILADYQRLGRTVFLEQQLAATSDALPPEVSEQIEQLQLARLDTEQVLPGLLARNKAINALPADERATEQMRLNQLANEIANEAMSRELLRAIYSPAQLREQMVWLNHFSVFQGKAQLRWLIGDYADRAIRPHALGHFRDLLLATLEHPAMLQYLDNQQNSAGHVNENYAREFMELHTLGVDAGYTQQDVQQLALVFTGVGIDAGPTPRLPRGLQSSYLRQGLFEFNPARHDSRGKRLLGHRVHGGGFREVENAVDVIVRQPACARFISRQLALYFVSDQPPPALVERMAQTFRRTDGDIAAVLRTMLLAPEFDAALGTKFKDPMRYVVSAVRLAYPDRTIVDTTPLINWLRALGELPFGRLTPDGYPLTEESWASPGQLATRFEVGRAISTGGGARLFEPESVANPPPLTASPVSRRLYAEVLGPYLAANTHAVLDRARSLPEWRALLLASPDFNYE